MTDNHLPGYSKFRGLVLLTNVQGFVEFRSSFTLKTTDQWPPYRIIYRKTRDLCDRKKQSLYSLRSLFRTSEREKFRVMFPAGGFVWKKLFVAENLKLSKETCLEKLNFSLFSRGIGVDKFSSNKYFFVKTFNNSSIFDFFSNNVSTWSIFPNKKVAKIVEILSTSVNKYVTFAHRYTPIKFKKYSDIAVMGYVKNSYI